MSNSKSEYSKDKINELLKIYQIEIPDAELYDIIYIANWCNSILYGSSISDEKHFMLFIKDLFEKEPDLIFNRQYADMAKKGIAIEWSDMI